MTKIGVGLHGLNGHQVHGLIENGDHPMARLVAVSGFGSHRVPSGARVYVTLSELLADPEVQLVSLCSPVRREQAADAIEAMRAGKHVYAEKPAAMTEGALDRIIETANDTGMQFHEMGGLSLMPAYGVIRDAIRTGSIGRVVQVLAQKSYPWTQARPAQEDVDGGLALQVGIYLTRFVEHVAGVRISGVSMLETQAGNPVVPHGCRMAVALQMTLENGGLATGIANYLKPSGLQCWGYEFVRIFGTEGMIESGLESGTVRRVCHGREPEWLEVPAQGVDGFDVVVGSLLGRTGVPVSLADELSPTRWIIRAKQSVMTA
jgi:predicted dehydrogenase